MRKRMGLVKKMLCLGLAGVLTGSLAAGCGQVQPAAGLEAQMLSYNYGEKESPEGAVVRLESEEEVGKAVSAAEIYEEIGRNVSLISPVEMSESFLSNYYGIDPEQLAEFVFSMSEEATSAETVALMKVKQEEDTERIAEALQVVVEEKRGEMENYLPEQFEIVNRSAVKKEGPYVWLVISEQEEAISRIIEDHIQSTLTNL